MEEMGAVVVLGKTSRLLLLHDKTVEEWEGEIGGISKEKGVLFWFDVCFV
jgi:hypothetical protein